MLELDLQQLQEVRELSGSLVRRTPLLPLPSPAGDDGVGEIHLKAESLQETGSFKLRGATAKLRAAGTDINGVISGSAGNHGRALAHAARRLDLPCVIYMPVTAAVSKAEAVRRLGATVIQEHSSVDECIERAQERAQGDDYLFVHPFDDPDVIKGNAGVGLEIVEDLPDVALVVIPVGGGGLASGVAAAVKLSRPSCRVIGVQAEACAPIASPSQTPAPGSIWTIADGIAIKRPSELTRGLLDRWVDEVVAVGEDAIAEGVVHLAEHAKLAAEGAGAVGVAALIEGAVQPAETGATAIVVSGGNIDPSVLAAVVNRHESRVGRRIRIVARVPDHPGGLAGLLQMIADAGGNLIDVVHVRETTELAVDQTDIELLLETRGREHSAEILAQLEEAGYATTT